MIHLFGGIEGVSLSDHFCKLLLPTSIGFSHYGAPSPAVPRVLLSGAARADQDSWIGLLGRKSGGWEPDSIEGVLYAEPAHALSPVVSVVWSVRMHCYLPRTEEETSGCGLTEPASGPAWMGVAGSGSEARTKGSVLAQGRGLRGWHFCASWIHWFPFCCCNQGHLKSLFPSFTDFGFPLDFFAHIRFEQGCQ